MQAMCGGHHEIFSYASTTGTLPEGSHMGTGGICEHLCTRRAPRYRYRIGRMREFDQKKGTLPSSKLGMQTGS